MGSQSEPLEPRGVLPSTAVELIDTLDERELQATIDYAQKRLHHVHPTVTEQIEAQADEEIVRKEKRDGYTEVVKSQSCPEGCADCPHGPYLYHVTEEKHSDGSTSLHWVYLGRVHK